MKNRGRIEEEPRTLELRLISLIMASKMLEWLLFLLQPSNDCPIGEQLPWCQCLVWAIQSGSLWSCTAHIITAVIGSGVLSLAWSTAQLGLIAGAVSLICFDIVTYVSAFLVSDLKVLEEHRHGFVVFLQNLSFYGTESDCLCYYYSNQAIQKSNCYHKEGHQAPCAYGDTFYMLLFGLVQIVVSQIPDFHKMEWLSVVAAMMSFTYSFIGIALGFAKVIENGKIMGSITGVPASTLANKFWLVFEAFGDIAFAYPYSIIVLEIQDTLKSPPPENQTMKRASMVAIFVTTCFYLCCGCFGYAAFGNDTPGNLLTGFGFYEPYWLIDFANACIVLHLLGGYQLHSFTYFHSQIYSQPVFAYCERWFTKKFSNSGFVNNFYTMKLPLLPGFSGIFLGYVSELHTLYQPLELQCSS
ncbi:putative amino acid permease 7 [Quercus suber]|uniref:Amino acid permease 7 n=1 Tax=Quercus suber TaxID=58331 RepID=A0AAW0JIF1_QUESU